jgi:capreomycidine synthase
MIVDVGRPPLLESWYRDHLHAARFDISSSGVQPYSMGEVRDTLDLTEAELDAIVFQDSVSFGAPPLRQAIADRYAAGASERVMATHGSSEAIALILSVLLAPGDRVVLFTPIYHSLETLTVLQGCRMVRLPIDLIGDDDRFVDAIAEQIIPGTKAVIVNSPHNPTGRALSADMFNRLINRAGDTGAFLVWDAAFAELPMQAAPLVSRHAVSQPHVITFGTLSKAFGLPGLRLGWCIAAPRLLDATLTIRDRTTLFLSPLIELIGARVFGRAEAFISPRLDQARDNLALVDDWISQHADKVSWHRPRGGVCGLLELHDLADTERFCRELLACTGVLLVPGTAFSSPGTARLGFGGSTAELREGLARLSEFLHRRPPLRG